MDLRAAFPLLLVLGLGCAEQGGDHGGANEEDLTTVIMKMNKGSDGYLLEGDMLIQTQRNAIRCSNPRYSCLWQKGASGYVEVPFEISNAYDNTDRNAIFTAMNEFKAKTCIRFVPRQREIAYLSIEPRAGCFSGVGRLGDKQVVSLQRFGCVQNGIIQHELLHALGFYHEHTRFDRDDYVRIQFNNVPSYMQYNFVKQESDYLNTPYDYSSVMHYGKTAFADAGTESIIPIPDSSVPIGQRVTMSDIDILRIKRLYKC
ncbi:hatching enzyme precursor [Gasterosteus aculeatus]|uniref:Metalloendopeptidase n=1 Tax=Gasterosteus aculeatus TaxID=69293 RepID=B0I307_GASAC|nr:hatching enzyme precursor [Gasterosteus aculeatus]BAG06179.1 hatching enzyme [Gasterosteus aculeatus]